MRKQIVNNFHFFLVPIHIGINQEKKSESIRITASKGTELWIYKEIKIFNLKSSRTKEKAGYKCKNDPNNLFHGPFLFVIRMGGIRNDKIRAKT